MNKAKVAVAHTYIVSTIDVIPEVFDDLYLSLKLFKNLLFDNKMPRDIQEELWPGMSDTLDNIDTIFDEVVKINGYVQIIFIL